RAVGGGSAGAHRGPGTDRRQGGRRQLGHRHRHHADGDATTNRASVGGDLGQVMTSGNGKSNGNGTPAHEVALVTGFPAFTARRLTERMLARTADDRVYLLVRDQVRNEADGFVASLPPSSASRLQIIEGDVADMDLGLPGPDYKALAAELTAIHHT